MFASCGRGSTTTRGYGVFLGWNGTDVTEDDPQQRLYFNSFLASLGFWVQMKFLRQSLDVLHLRTHLR